MKKLFGFVVLILLALIGFYVVWPGYSGYQIANALKANDEDALAGKIDFDSVRGSLRPVVATEVDRHFAANSGGLEGPLMAQVKREVVPKLIETTLATVLTPTNVIRIYNDGGDYRETIAKIMREQIAKGGGLGGLIGIKSGLPGGSGEADRPSFGDIAGALGGLAGAAEKFGIDPRRAAGGSAPASPAPATTRTPPDGTKASYGLSNVKKVGLAGPFGLVVGVAKDPKAAEPDVTAGMSFTGGTWKLTSIVPRLP